MIYYLIITEDAQGAGRYDPTTGQWTEITKSLRDKDKAPFGINETIPLAMDLKTLQEYLLSCEAISNRSKVNYVESSKSVTERVLATIIVNEKQRQAASRLVGSGPLAPDCDPVIHPGPMAGGETLNTVPDYAMVRNEHPNCRSTLEMVDGGLIYRTVVPDRVRPMEVGHPDPPGDQGPAGDL